MKAYENRIRRELGKVGLLLRKSRKGISLDNFGEYMVIDMYTGFVILGSRYDWSLEDIENWLSE